MKLADIADDFGNRGPLVSAQRYRNPEIVAEKMREGDFRVQVVPIRSHRVVVDGHHALSAALKAKARPRFVLCVERCPGEDENLDAWLRDQRRRGGSTWHDPVTGRPVAMERRHRTRSALRDKGTAITGSERNLR